MRHLKILLALAGLYFRTVGRGWFLRPPFLPIPPRPYIQWRLKTAYGTHRPPWQELLRDLWQFGDWLAQFPLQKGDSGLNR